jgi:hypothetical protein
MQSVDTHVPQAACSLHGNAAGGNIIATSLGTTGEKKVQRKKSIADLEFAKKKQVLW